MAHLLLHFTRIITVIFLVWRMQYQYLCIMNENIFNIPFRPWEARAARLVTRAKPIKKNSDEIIYETAEKANAMYEDMERHKVM
jgi:hypothetical protein